MSPTVDFFDLAVDHVKKRVYIILNGAIINLDISCIYSDYLTVYILFVPPYKIC